MLVLNPEWVSLLGTTIEGVRRVVVQRSAARSLVEWGDEGAFPIFADVPEQRVEIEVVADIARDSLEGAAPGDEGTLRFFTAPVAGSGGRRRVEASVVVLEARYDVEPGSRAQRRWRMVALSDGGAADPIEVTSGEDGDRGA
ncbi:MAG: hypothetical protein AAFX79_09040 [Planctomycetota bacterium]